MDGYIYFAFYPKVYNLSTALVSGLWSGPPFLLCTCYLKLGHVPPAADATILYKGTHLLDDPECSAAERERESGKQKLRRCAPPPIAWNLRAPLFSLLLIHFRSGNKIATKKKVGQFSIWCDHALRLDPCQLGNDWPAERDAITQNSRDSSVSLSSLATTTTRELRHLNTFEFDRGRLGTLSLSTIPPDDEALSEPKIPGLSLQSSLRRRRRRDVITCSTVLSTYVYNIIKTPNYSVLGVVAYI